MHVLMNLQSEAEFCVEAANFRHLELAFPGTILTHRIHVCYIYMVTFTVNIYTPNVSIYTIHGSYG
jgi:hypothetical protein